MQSTKSKPAVEPIEFPANGDRADPGQQVWRPSKSRLDEKLLTPQEVAERLGVSPRWVRDHATRRLPRIPAVKLGPLLRFRGRDIEDFLTRHMFQGPSKNESGGV